MVGDTAQEASETRRKSEAVWDWVQRLFSETVAGGYIETAKSICPNSFGLTMHPRQDWRGGVDGWRVLEGFE
jgi:hypothetical protein